MIELTAVTVMRPLPALTTTWPFIVSAAPESKLMLPLVLVRRAVDESDIAPAEVNAMLPEAVERTELIESVPPLLAVSVIEPSVPVSARAASMVTLPPATRENGELVLSWVTLVRVTASASVMEMAPLAVSASESASSVAVMLPAEVIETSPALAVLVMVTLPLPETMVMVPTVPVIDPMVTEPVALMVRLPPFIAIDWITRLPVWFTVRLPEPFIVTFRFWTAVVSVR